MGTPLAAVGGSALLGLSLSHLCEKFHRELCVDFVPFRDRDISDQASGWFIRNADRDAPAGEKVTWHQGRGPWVYNLGTESKASGFGQVTTVMQDQRQNQFGLKLSFSSCFNAGDQ